ncbi:MAG: site-specific DNA-methyltransferase [Armatimonadetes bacterium]|nr:site-specific DNA-methyltransferase [Armatimonadota bacterium]
MPRSVETLKHKDKRANIPTEELRDFVAEEEKSPKTILYPRDPSLDPQLVWKGKDEQDQEDLAVPAVPVYIQEKIHPQAIIENVRALPSPAGGGRAGDGGQPSLFADFNGGPVDFAQKVDFYHHEQNWSNRMILGDSSLVMTSLAEKEGLKGKVQMIYIDPPYGIRFGSNWQVSTRKRDVKDGKAEDATRQPEQVKAFRDTWQLGIHSYLAYLRDRLTVARELLTESGSVFVQIGDENVHLVRCLMDEVFGSESFVNQIGFQKSSGRISDAVDAVYDTLIWYAKDREQHKFKKLYRVRTSQQVDTSYNVVELADGTLRGLMPEEVEEGRPLPDGARRFRPSQLYSQTPSPSSLFAFEMMGKKYRPSPGAGWRTSEEGLARLLETGRVLPRGQYVAYKLFADDFPFVQLHNIWTDTLFTEFGSGKVYVVQTAPKAIERCLLMTTDPGDLVLDPTCGSGTTAYVAEQWGRRWITCDTSRVALALARTRVMAARFPYYILADELDPQITQIDAEKALKSNLRKSAESADIKKGFVYKRVPHVTLKSIANNPEIDAIHAKWQEKLEPVQEELNRLLGTTWEEWEIPRTLEDLPGTEQEDTSAKRGKRVGRGIPSRLPSVRNQPAETDTKAQKDLPPYDTLARIVELHAEWWRMRRQRQKEIDASIARRADTEILYDQPYEDNKKVRVTGPFTVESLSPHRTISVEEKKERSEFGKDGWKVKVIGPSQFATTIIENLKKAGVQNTVKGERLKFDTLDPFAGEWIHAEGRYTEQDGSQKRVAICIGPEHGTVGAQLVKEAAKEAVKGVGFDMLIVCGFAFDPSVSEEIKRYGKLTVLPTKMNPDLAMGDELLKKTGAGNLFMVFGEPDIEISYPQISADGKEKKNLRQSVKSADSQIVVEVKGVDVYDPTTGEIRSSSTDDIACWFIDTNYNGESFFVRHAYFTGADEPYDKLKRALRAEIDEAAWQTLYTTVSQPFAPPETGKIAVKVINHYGDEVMKVFEV